MPFLTLKRVIVNDAWSHCPTIYNYLILEHARTRLKHELSLLKTAGASFDDNQGPNTYKGTLPNGITVSCSLVDEPFDDDARIFTNELSIYTR